ncbi:MAG: hypothetical protein QMD00_03835 [Hadesarchaea archaeon]|nr:hypothetical protein [Hadesarchaea archaeon]
MSSILSDQECDYATYEEELKRRAWKTLPRIHKLILFIYKRFANVPFGGSQLYNEFLKICSARRDILRQSMEELKKRGYVIQFKRISHRKRLWVATVGLFEQAAKIHGDLNKQTYIRDIPEGTLQLRGYIRLHKKTRSSHLVIFSKALSDASRKHTIRCEIYRHRDAFIIRTEQSVRKACPRDWEVDLPIPKRLLYKNELEVLTTGKTMSTIVYIVPEDWELKKWDLFTETPEARKLVKALSKHFVIDVLPGHNYHVNKWRFDVITENFVVEVTTQKPRPTKCAPHSSQASIIRGKVLDGLLYSLEKNRKSVIVVSSAWKKKRYLCDLKATVQPYGCHILFADFDKSGWADEIAGQIVTMFKSPAPVISQFL